MILYAKDIARRQPNFDVKKVSLITHCAVLLLSTVSITLVLVTNSLYDQFKYYLATMYMDLLMQAFLCYICWN